MATGTAVIVASSEGARASVPVTISPITVAKVTVSPTGRLLESGKALQLTATITDVRGRTIAGKVPTWTTANPGNASVSTTGRVVAVAPGSVTISAMSDGVSGVVAITVIPVKVARITLVPAVATLYSGRTLTLMLQLADAAGRPLATTGRTILWSSDTPSVATVDIGGVVTGVGPGTAVVAATTDGVRGSASLSVTNVPVSSVSVSPAIVSLTTGSTLQFTATAFDASGAPIPGRVATWGSDAPAVASVDSAGRATALTPGTARLSAVIDGFQANATLTVAAVPVSSVTIAPAAPSVAVGASRALTATLYGPVPNVPLSPVGRTVTWSVLGSGIATISAAGVVKGVSPGTTTVTVSARSPGQSSPAMSTISLTVVP